MPRPRRSWWWLLFGLLVVPIAVTYGAYWLLSKQGVSFEVLRTAATVGLGAGGLVTLGALLHRQRLAQQSHALARAEHARQLAAQAHQIADAERRFEQVERNAADNLAHARGVAAAAQADAIEKRAQELFVKAVDQLGHDKAAVRVGALHALDALGQEHVDRRRAVMDVWCAYLRMPPPGTKPDTERASAPQAWRRGRAPLKPRVKAKGWPAEELQVRGTLQRLIAHHLRPPGKLRGKKRPKATGSFWGLMDLDLTGADLHGLDLSDCRLGEVGFAKATFNGTTRFAGATFAQDAWFREATFMGRVFFSGAAFLGPARFDDAMFYQDVGFGEAKFTTRAPTLDGARVLAPDRGHAWPEGWRVAATDDGTEGRPLERVPDGDPPAADTTPDRGEG